MAIFAIGQRHFPEKKTINLIFMASGLMQTLKKQGIYIILVQLLPDWI